MFFKKKLHGEPHARCDADITSSQSSESVSRHEPLPVTAGNHIQERPEQLPTTHQQAQLHQGTNTNTRFSDQWIWMISNINNLILFRSFSRVNHCEFSVSNDDLCCFFNRLWYVTFFGFVVKTKQTIWGLRHGTAKSVFKLKNEKSLVSAVEY